MIIQLPPEPDELQLTAKAPIHLPREIQRKKNVRAYLEKCYGHNGNSADISVDGHTERQLLPCEAKCRR
ncbi:hypothetical protein D3C73_1639740 [compost metagenome]|jgi:hypothetical protein